jgi:coenzyme F420-0:L-glutamate ligase / coenzyme F420-1:gamma-L-glutamate ligase
VHARRAAPAQSHARGRRSTRRARRGRRRLTVVAAALAGLPEIRPGDDLGRIVADSTAGDLAEGDVLVVSHKVVSKAEGRLRRLPEVEPGEQARALALKHGKDPRFVQVVLDEASELLRDERGVLVCETRHGFVCANAGVDGSNVPDEDAVVLLPEDPDASARVMRAQLLALTGVAPGVVIADTFGRPWRLGQTDVAIGAAGISPLVDWRGRRDHTGRELRVTQLAAADALAATADLARAKDSMEPVVRVRGLARLVTAEDGPGAAALRRPREEDLFR